MTASLELVGVSVRSRSTGLVPGASVPLPSAAPFRVGRADTNDLVLRGVRGARNVVIEPCLGSHTIASVLDAPLTINGDTRQRRHLFEDGDLYVAGDGVAVRYRASDAAIPCIQALGPYLLVDPLHSRGRNDVWRAVRRADVGGDIVVINRLPGHDPIGRYRAGLAARGLASMRAETMATGEQLEVWTDLSGPTLAELIAEGRRQGGVIDDGVLKAILLPVAEATAALADLGLHTSIRTHQVVVGFDGRAHAVFFDPVYRHLDLLYDSPLRALSAELEQEQASALGDAVMRNGPALLRAVQAWSVPAASAADVAGVVAALFAVRAAREATLREALAVLDEQSIRLCTTDAAGAARLSAP
jgi:hypothetical protein